MNHRRYIVLLIPMITALTLTPGINAHGEATGVVKERMELMKSMGEAAKGLGQMFKGEAPYDEALVLEHATTLAEQSPQIVDLFPEGSNEDPSEALPVIWEQWDEFTAAAGELQTQSEALLEVATSNAADQDAVRAQFARTGKTCSNCHETFRKPKE